MISLTNTSKWLIPALVVMIAAGVFGQSPGAFSRDDPPDPPIGTMIYVVGEVGVHRNGSMLSADLIDIGLEIADYDLVETGRTGTAEVMLETPATRGMTILVSEDTAFYFDVESLEGRQRTSVHMLSGSVGLKVKKLTGTAEVRVQTRSVVMGVRGTEFTVTAAPDGSYLVTCREGEVLCEDDDGESASAVAGRVVEKTSDSLRSIAVPVSELDRYRTDWAAERERIFRTAAPSFVRSFARQYRTFEPRFLEALAGLLEQRDVFAIWADAYSRGVEIPTAELLKQRSRVTPSVVAVRSVLPVYEQLFYRLKTLARYHEQGIGRTTIERGITSTDFFSSFDRNGPSIEQGLAAIRYYLKLYTWMAPFGDSSLLEEVFGDDPLGESGPPEPIDPRSF